jgi:hypothetical protein
MRKQSFILWIVALFITIGSAVYQRMTGPSYPLSGSVVLAGKEVVYRLSQSEVQRNAEVKIPTGDSTTRGWIEWKRIKTDDPWTKTAMTYRDRSLLCELPMQPPAGKLVYRVVLENGGQLAVVPPSEAAVIRFKGNVPGLILWTHILTMFLAMMFSTRAGLEFFSSTPRLRTLTFLTVSFLFLGGVILGPLVQKYAFDAYWTGWPFGTDLTDNKTALALLGWVAATVAIYKSKRPKAWVLAAAIILLLVYLIPHSFLGSELDYSKLDSKHKNIPQAAPDSR